MEIVYNDLTKVKFGKWQYYDYIQSVTIIRVIIVGVDCIRSGTLLNTVVKNIHSCVFSQGRCNATKTLLLLSFISIHCAIYIVLYGYPVL